MTDAAAADAARGSGTRDRRAPPPGGSAPLTPGEWRAVKAVVQAALDLPPAERAAFVVEACEGNAALRAEVESLLEAPDTGVGADDFLELPPIAAVVGPLAHDAGDGRADGADGADADGELAALAAALAERYAVERRLGRGGMATVYLARDLRHARPVAIKVLHPSLAVALGAERFLREIALTASLQHPHVLPLFDSGQAGGRLYYVMPYVDGETLRARLARGGPLPVDEAVRLAREIADALDHAHARGIVHRDVKPENVLLQGGARAHAVVADFGVALALEQAGGTRLTRTGLSIGTPQYMAPEQAAGARTVDARADVYALGAVLYEMLAGAPPSGTGSAAVVLRRVLHEAPPPLLARRPDVPPPLADAVERALAKDPGARFSDVQALAGALGAAVPTPAPGTPPTPASAPASAPTRRPLPVGVWLGAAAVLAVAVPIAWGRAPWRGTGAPTPPLPVNAAVDGPGAARRELYAEPGSLGEDVPALTPDGVTLVFRHAGADGARLYARGVDDLVPRALAGTEDAESPFVSPDGRWVGFVARGALRRVLLDGGPAARVAELPAGSVVGGAAWGPDDVLLVADGRTGALARVPAAGGALARVPTGGPGRGVRDPHVLPGARAALVTLADCCADRMGMLDLVTGELREIGRGLSPRLVAGHVVFATRDGALHRQPIDPARWALTGSSTRIADGVAIVDGRAAFAVSASGTLVYRAAAPDSDERRSHGALRLTVRDRSGREVQRPSVRTPWTPRVAPDGHTVLHGSSGSGGSELWTTDLRTGRSRRLTADGVDANDAQWSPDGRLLAYSTSGPGGKGVSVRPAAGGVARPLTRGDGSWFPTDWLPDGRALLATADRGGSRDVMVLPIDGSAARPYAATPADERAARIAPDGRWVAYQSDESGRAEVYVDGHPTPGRRARISVDGGVHPVWSRDGRELFYWAGDRLIAAQLAPPAPEGSGAPRAVTGRTPLFRAPHPDAMLAMYDVTPDGRFVLAAAPSPRDRLVVVSDALSARR